VRIRPIIACVIASAVLALAAADDPRVLIRSEKGDIVVDVDLARAPLTPPVKIISVRRTDVPSKDIR
jgi:hypothetical protein